ncbi:hypothetical protein CH373_02100 [Leptospira perolatii]|uniref:Uncharacterized protein n=1 Tax=Leptospira perolatii TaxID=2023191 RepID=A0A2M9ZT62_9LEPT|nr:hypothetical protein CH360_02100 [Leptospira perolatii]PJZ75205.1 hypothetical protein CH373_02100 [Leptospira perolatii]
MSTDSLSQASAYISRFRAERGKIRSFLSKFPFYADIVKNHEYYNTDLLIRKELASRIDALKEPLRRIEEGFVRQRRLELIGSTEILLSQVDRLKNEIVGAGYGLTGIGSGFKATEKELESLADWDYSLLSHAEELKTKVNAHGLQAEDSESKVRDWVSQFRVELDQFDSALKKRKEVFLKA